MTTKRIVCRRQDDTVIISCVPNYKNSEHLMSVAQKDNPGFESYHEIDINELPANQSRRDWAFNRSGRKFYLKNRGNDGSTS